MAQRLEDKVNTSVHIDTGLKTAMTAVLPIHASAHYPFLLVTFS